MEPMLLLELKLLLVTTITFLFLRFVLNWAMPDVPQSLPKRYLCGIYYCSLLYSLLSALGVALSMLPVLSKTSVATGLGFGLGRVAFFCCLFCCLACSDSLLIILVRRVKDLGRTYIVRLLKLCFRKLASLTWLESFTQHRCRSDFTPLFFISSIISTTDESKFPRLCSYS